MTNRLALILAVILIAAAVADGTMNDGAAMLFLARKVLDLAAYIAFWR